MGSELVFIGWFYWVGWWWCVVMKIDVYFGEGGSVDDEWDYEWLFILVLIFWVVILNWNVIIWEFLFKKSVLWMGIDLYFFEFFIRFRNLEEYESLVMGNVLGFDLGWFEFDVVKGFYGIDIKLCISC